MSLQERAEAFEKELRDWIEEKCKGNPSLGPTAIGKEKKFDVFENLYEDGSFSLTWVMEYDYATFKSTPVLFKSMEESVQFCNILKALRAKRR